MAKDTTIRDLLLTKGYFPEVLPPCFDSRHLVNAIEGISDKITDMRFKKRTADYVRYSGTKHDGHRRAYGTVNPIPYFSACQFVSDHWDTFEGKFKLSKLALERLRLGKDDEDRAIVVPTLSQLTGRMSSRLRFSPYVLKADISQFFPSIYTHTISWVAHGREQAKKDRGPDSTTCPFNGLDWHVQQCQSGQTRGVVVGPDLFRILAEFISSDIDAQLFKKARKQIVGGVRHVDDFYIGVRNEIDATVVLARLREVLQIHELQTNDNKTRVLSGLSAFDDVWAQELRAIRLWSPKKAYPYIIEKAHEVAQSIQSQSPMKLVLRRLDRRRCYKDEVWTEIESKLQRILWHYGHCTDYVCLLVAKRFALGEPLDVRGWSGTLSALMKKQVDFGHHHEICWLLWMALVCKLPLSPGLIEQAASLKNAHIWSIIIAAHQSGRLKKKPSIRLGHKLSTTEADWLHNLVGRSLDYSKASFSGDFSEEFEHLAKGGIRWIDFDEHIKAMADKEAAAISSSKYGYDADADDEDEDDLLFGDSGLGDDGDDEHGDID